MPTPRDVFRKTPPRLALEPGDLLSLEVGQDGDASGSRTRARYVGNLPGEFVVLHVPHLARFGTELAMAGRNTVRFIHEGTAYGFRSQVLHMGEAPAPLLFLSYPKSVEKLSIRECSRVDIFIKAELTAGGVVVPGAVVDLSCGGCKFVPDDPALLSAGPGSAVTLTFLLAADEPPVAVHGQVANIGDKDETWRDSVGVVFDKPQAETETRIRAWIEFMSRFRKSE